MDTAEGMEFYPRLRSRGQVTIPQDIREALGVERGDRIRVIVDRLDTDEAEADE